jgi:hypothetical protein
VASTDADKYDRELVHLIGWGSSTDINGKASTVLKRADIKVYSQRLVFSSNYILLFLITFVIKKMICLKIPH